MALTPYEGLEWPDYLVIVLYFVFVLFIGLYTSWKSKRDSVSGYFLASKSMNFIPVGASLFASNIGSGHFIGLAGTAAASGIAISIFEFSAIFYIILLGWIFIPVYTAAEVYTMPEYLKLRFGGRRIQMYLSVLTLILYVFTKISADLFAGALFITTTMQTDGPLALYLAVLVLLVIAGVFTIAGGLTAVMWTDFIQTVMMIVGAFILTGLVFSEIGGYDNLMDQFFKSKAENQSLVDPFDNSSGYCGDVPDNAMHLFHSIVPGESDLPWTGVIFGLAISSIWYWCSDQVIVQRALAAKDLTHAKAGCVLSAYMKLLPLWIIVFPGMAARILFPNTVACASPEACFVECQSYSGCTNVAYVKLVNELMPAGLRGLMLSVMLAALMSSLTSIFNSASTIFTMDIYTKIRPKASERELIISGRVFVFLLIVVSVIWIPIIKAFQGSQLFIYIQSVTSYLAPPICAIYLLAIFWARTNEAGAFWGLMIGLVIGLIRFALQFSVTKPPCGNTELFSPPPYWWKLIVDDINYLHFGIILWIISGLSAIIISLLTPPIPKECLYRLTYSSRKSTKVRLRIVDAYEQQDKETANLDDVTLTLEEKAQNASDSIKESSFWSLITDANAILIMSIACFFAGFYA